MPIKNNDAQISISSGIATTLSSSLLSNTTTSGSALVSDGTGAISWVDTSSYYHFNTPTPVGHKMNYGGGKEFIIKSEKGNFFIDKKSKKVLMCISDGIWRDVDLKSFNISISQNDWVSKIKNKKSERKLICEKIKKIDFDYSFNFLTFNGNAAFGNYSIVSNSFGNYSIGSNSFGTTALSFSSMIYMDASEIGITYGDGNLFIDFINKIVYKFEKDEVFTYEIDNIEFELTAEQNIVEIKNERISRTFLCEKIKKENKEDKYYYEFNKPSFTLFSGLGNTTGTNNTAIGYVSMINPTTTITTGSGGIINYVNPAFTGLNINYTNPYTITCGGTNNTSIGYTALSNVGYSHVTGSILI